MVDALERIHTALDEGGVVVDTQPVSERPPVEGPDGALGTLDMSAWATTIAAIDELVMSTVERGLFGLGAERRFVVTDWYDDGGEFVSIVSGWQGTKIPQALARRAAPVTDPIQVHQEIRLRLLHRR